LSWKVPAAQDVHTEFELVEYLPLTQSSQLLDAALPVVEPVVEAVTETIAEPIVEATPEPTPE
jgi:hypothetical protein